MTWGVYMCVSMGYVYVHVSMYMRHQDASESISHVWQILGPPERCLGQEQALA